TATTTNPTSSRRHYLRADNCLSHASKISDDLIQVNLESCSIYEQKQAAMEIKLLAKNKSENRLKIARAGTIKPSISLISSSDHILQENDVTMILNLGQI
ncbi:hypothetical protein U1Q18_013812, partial [Sarracenia purpurea var. burkii]